MNGIGLQNKMLMLAEVMVFVPVLQRLVGAPTEMSISQTTWPLCDKHERLFPPVKLEVKSIGVNVYVPRVRLNATVIKFWLEDTIFPFHVSEYVVPFCVTFIKESPTMVGGVNAYKTTPVEGFDETVKNGWLFVV